MPDELIKHEPKEVVASSHHRYDRKVLFDSGDGPDGICLYTSEDRAAVDFANDMPSLYLEASVNGAMVVLGPFMRKVRLDLEKALGFIEEKETNE